ncbi:MAG: ribonuclease D [Alphaproteobacteria bacterium]|nr:MAG: ribonuclease D [Alphaproteobacteria bacterium]
MTIITDTQALARACEGWARERYITVDTEFKRETTYWAELALVQVAGADFHAAIDPLAPGLSLDPFYDLMRNEKVLKVFHAARQDIEIFVHEMGDVPHPLFDTQVAAMVCGFGESVGYETLVNTLTGAKLDKVARFMDWTKRPLTRRQIDYALGDVTHLRTIYEKLSAKLEQTGRAGWLDEEMDILTDPATYRNDPDDAWLRLKPRSRNRRFLAIVREVAAWRERYAQDNNLARNRVVRDDVVLEVAAHAPKDADALAGIRGFPNKIARGPAGEDLLGAIRKAENLPDNALPTVASRKGHDRSAGPTADALKLLLKIKSQEHQVAAKLIATTADVERLADEQKPDIRALKGWRYEIFGKDALAVRDGKLAFAVRAGKLITVPLD